MALTRIEPQFSRRIYTALGKSGNVNVSGSGGFYQALAPGHHRITAVATAPGALHITNARSAKARYLSQDLSEHGSTVVEVTVPKGQEHYLNVWLNETSDVRVAMEHLATP